MRVKVRLPEAPRLDQESIPCSLLEFPGVVGEVVRKLDEGAVIVPSNDELERSIEARMRIEMHCEGWVGLESGAVVPHEGTAPSER